MEIILNDNIPIPTNIKYNILAILLFVHETQYNLALHTAKEKWADVVLFTEQNRVGEKEAGWYADQSGRSAVLDANDLPMNKIRLIQDIGFRWVKAGGLTIYSCYSRLILHKPNTSCSWLVWNEGLGQLIPR